MQRCLLLLCGLSVAVSASCTATPLSKQDLPRQCRKANKRKNKKYLRSLSDCEEASSGEICRGDGSCGTGKQLNNCGKFDLYRRGDDNDNDNNDDDDNNNNNNNGGVGSKFQWPEYSQQCRDDAGPVWEDDNENFGKKQYHSKSKAIAVLKNGECADPIKDACKARAGDGPVTADDARAAYLEGPLQCGNKGWFCRILPDKNHKGGDQSDWNFNHCNRTDYGDTDGHCHGSDTDNTFYWWVRDHWHRNYAGRLHCCCDWKATEEVVARCDYRAPLKKGENKKCRDANEDHDGPGSGFSKGYEKGCKNLGAKNMPEPDDSQCWDVLNFAPGGKN